MWGLYVDNSRNVLGHVYKVTGIVVKANANNVKCMYTSVSGHTVDFSDFIWVYKLT